MSDTPTPLQERVAQLCDPYQGEEGANAVKMLAKEVGRVELGLADAHRTIESLRASVRGLIGLCEGADAKNAIQRGKDLL